MSRRLARGPMIAGLLSLLSPLVASSQAGDVPGLPERTFSSAGVPITYVDSGRGPVVVLLHGNGSRLRWWYRNGVAPLRIRRAHIAGYSMGAMTTVQFLTLHPERAHGWQHEMRRKLAAKSKVDQ